ncbi:LD-carboxypeptidase [Bacteroidales bacterium OttesenSCG-928-I21]|nr:LD-carboxypeptidase [Bacteroidales bacterium OttesenSCG-928-I21]
MKLQPNFLTLGSKIAIISPAGIVDEDYVFSASNSLKSQGFLPVVYPNALNKYHQFSGRDQDRLSDLQNALDNQEIKAILCARGGYGLLRIIDKIDFSNFLKSPKWVIGFSDITNLHLALNKMNAMSIHAQMTKAFHDNESFESVDSLIKLLKGDIPNYELNINKLNRFGTAEAELIGGNLSILYSLQGTKFEPETDGKILFIEDLNEYLYHLDRMMLNLRLSGKLKKLKGLVVGSFTDMKDNQNSFGKTAYEIIKEHVSDYDFPVCFDFPAGHIKNNMPLVVGLKYKLVVDSEFASLFV